MGTSSAFATSTHATTTNASTSGHPESSTEPSRKLHYTAEDDTDKGVEVIEQVTGRKGDVILMHPLLVHCGTQNLGLAPRVMANGMVRLKRGRENPLMAALK